MKRHSFESRVFAFDEKFLDKDDVWGVFTRGINTVNQQCELTCYAVDRGQTGSSALPVLNAFAIPEGKVLSGSPRNPVKVEKGSLYRFSKDAVENDFCCCDSEKCICNNLDGKVLSPVRSQGGIQIRC